MKKILSCLLILIILFSAAAFASEISALDDDMFAYTKNALAALAAGAYDKMVTALPFADLSPSADEWQNIAEDSFTDLPGSKPQSKYAVAYWKSSCWKIAVPVSKPGSDDVEALVLISQDGSSFTGYGVAHWGQIVKEYQSSEYVLWDEEYIDASSVIIEFDDH